MKNQKEVSKCCGADIVYRPIIKENACARCGEPFIPSEEKEIKLSFSNTGINISDGEPWNFTEKSEKKCPKPHCRCMRISPCNNHHYGEGCLIPNDGQTYRIDTSTPVLPEKKCNICKYNTKYECHDCPCICHSTPAPVEDWKTLFNKTFSNIIGENKYGIQRILNEMIDYNEMTNFIDSLLSSSLSTQRELERKELIEHILHLSTMNTPEQVLGIIRKWSHYQSKIKNNE